MKRILSVRILVTMILPWVLAVSCSLPIANTRFRELYGAGKYEEALPFAIRDVERCKARAREKPANYAASLHNLAELYQSMGDYGRAEPLYKQALAIEKETLGEKHPYYAGSLCGLAVLYGAMGDYGRAEALHKQTLEIVKETLGEKHPDYARGLNNLGALYWAMGDYGHAEPLYKQALAIRKKVLGEKHPSYATDLNNLAALYRVMGDYARAEPLYKQALAIQKEVLGEKHPVYATSLHNLAALYGSMGDYGRAEPLYKQALAIEKEALGEKHPDYATDLNNLAALYGSMGDYGRAEPLYKQSLAIIKETLGENHPTYAVILNNLGRLYGCVKKPQLALEYQDASLGSTAAFLDAMALWASEKRQETYAATVEFRYDLFYSLLARFFAGRGGGAAEAKRGLEAHLAYKGRSLEALATRNRLALVSGDPRLARIAEELASVVRQIANLSFAGPGKGDPAAHKRRIAQLEEKKESLESELARGSAEYAERGAAHKATADGVAAALPKLSLYLDFVEYTRYDYDAAKWTTERRYLAFLLVPNSEGGAAVRIEDLGPADEINALARRFRAVLRGESDPGGAGDPKVAGNPGGENDPTGAAGGGAADSGVGRKIGTRPSAAAQRIETPEAQRIRTAGARLYEKILRPFDAEIQQADQIVLSPSGELNLMPFEVLTAPGRKGYLTDHWAVAYCLGRDLVGEAFRVKSVRERKDVNAAQIVAAPDFDRTAESGGGPVAAGGGRIAMGEGETRTLSPRLPARTVLKEWPMRVGPLPGTLTEGTMILSKLRGGTGKLWSGPEAAEGVVKAMKQPRFLHFATHGFFLEDVERAAPDEKGTISVGTRPVVGNEGFLAAGPLKGLPELHNPLLRSGLALAGFNRLAEGVSLPPAANDGILTAMEVTGLDLNGTGLAVLSACETGLGETRRGEGVAGLRRAFRIAGARNVLMSLWNVPDQETVWLMEAFYDAYLVGAPPAAALAKARKTVRERLLARDGFDNPRYWAAFVVEGPSLFGQER